jgi:hypothetical protein
VFIQITSYEPSAVILLCFVLEIRFIVVAIKAGEDPVVVVAAAADVIGTVDGVVGDGVIIYFFTAVSMLSSTPYPTSTTRFC